MAGKSAACLAAAKTGVWLAAQTTAVQTWLAGGKEAVWLMAGEMAA